MFKPARLAWGFWFLVWVLLSGCASTQLLETWKTPEPGVLRFQKAAVLVFDPSQTWRRIGEDEIVRRLPEMSVVPGYRIFPDSSPDDFQKISGRLREFGFDGAIVLRTLGVEYRVNRVPGPPVLSRPYRYYYFGGSSFYNPGYYRTDQMVRVETSIYSLAQNRLLWSGVTESFNPSSQAAMVAEIAEAVMQNLRKQGLL